MDMSELELKEKDVDQNLNIEGVELSDGSLVSPTYLLRLAKQSGIIQAQVTKVISMLEPSQDKVEAVIKKLVDLCPFVDECNKQCTPADQANCWELHAREICRLFHTLPNLEKELKEAQSE